jgi:hypothetical protein
VSQVASSPAQSGRGPDRPPVRARSGRKPVPPLVFLLVLALAAGAAWIWVFSSGHTTSAASCTPAAPSMAPGTVTVHVLNASQKQGAASAVAKELQARGFQVGAPADNDRSGRSVSGVGEIRFGARGAKQAAYLKAYLPGATEYQDTRATAVVDMVIGPDYQSLATQQQVTAAIEAPTC